MIPIIHPLCTADTLPWFNYRIKIFKISSKTLMEAVH